MVKFNRFVEIENPRLDALCYCCWFFYVGVFIFLSWIGAKWKQPFAVNSSVWLRTYSEAHYPKLKQSFENGRANSSVCQDPTKYEFSYDAEGQKKFHNFTCGKLCNLHELRPDCISRHQLVRVHGTEQIDFITYVEDVAFRTLEDSYNGNSTPTVNRTVLPWNAREMTLGVYYGISTPKRSYINPYRREAGEETYTSHENILTVIHDPAGKTVAHFKPNQHALHFTLQEMLEWSQESGTFDLDHHHHGKHTNHKTGGYPTGPIPRISGANLFVNFQCFNYMPIPPPVAWDGVVCILRFEYLPGFFEGHQLVAAVDGSGLTTQRSYHAIRVSFVVSATFYFDSAILFVLHIIQFIVLSAIPQYVIWLIVSRCLGKNSEIYRNAVVHTLDLTEECKGCAARVMCNNVCYSQLQAAYDKNTLGGLKKDIIAKILSECIANKLISGIDEMKTSSTVTGRKSDTGAKNEMTPTASGKTSQLSRSRPELNRARRLQVEENEKAFRRKAIQAKGILDFCYQSLVGKKKHTLSITEEMHLLCGGNTKAELEELDDPEDGVTITQFIDACQWDDAVHMHDLVMLFDSERAQSCFEYAFADNQIVAYQDYARCTLARESESITCFFESEMDDTNKGLQALRFEPRSRMDRILQRLGELEDMVKAGHELKPPIVVQLPAVLNMDKLVDQTKIEVTLDKSRGASLGLQLVAMKLGSKAGGEDYALVVAVSAVGLAADWNECHAADEQIRVNDRIIRVNEIEYNFFLMEKELLKDKVLNLSIQKIETKVVGEIDKHASLGESSEDAKAHATADLNIQEQRQALLDTVEAIEKRTAEYDRLAIVAKATRSKIDYLKKALVAMEGMFACNQYETVLISKIIFGQDDFCTNCGKSFPHSTTQRFCSHCLSRKVILPSDYCLSISDPEKGTYDLQVESLGPQTDVHIDRIRKRTRTESSSDVVNSSAPSRQTSCESHGSRQSPNLSKVADLEAKEPVLLLEKGDEVEFRKDLHEDSWIPAMVEGVHLSGTPTTFNVTTKRSKKVLLRRDGTVARQLSRAERKATAPSDAALSSSSEEEQQEEPPEPSAFDVFTSRYFGNISSKLVQRPNREMKI